MKRFFDKFDVTPKCWEWIAAKYPAGYGSFYYNGRNGYAHRFSYEFYNGPIPDRLTIDHLCRNKSCVNPWHLEAVTNQENVRRAFADACHNGHDMTDPANYTMDNKGAGRLARRCLICRRNFDKKRYRENGAR